MSENQHLFIYLLLEKKEIDSELDIIFQREIQVHEAWFLGTIPGQYQSFNRETWSVIIQQ